MDKAQNIDLVLKKFNNYQDLIVKNIHCRDKLADRIYELVKYNGPVYYEGYKYYIRREYTTRIVDTNKLKIRYPSVYEDCLKTVTIKPRLIRSVANGKYNTKRDR